VIFIVFRPGEPQKGYALGGKSRFKWWLSFTFLLKMSVKLPSEVKGTNFGLDFGLIAYWRKLFDAEASKDRFRQRV
jgi:hypothetical protein